MFEYDMNGTFADRALLRYITIKTITAQAAEVLTRKHYFLGSFHLTFHTSRVSFSRRLVNVNMVPGRYSEIFG